MNTFTQSFAKRQQALWEKVVTILEKKRGKPFAKVAPQRLLAPSSVVSQKCASGLLPPGRQFGIASNYGWAARCPPLRRDSVSALKTGGGFEAMQACLRGGGGVRPLRIRSERPGAAEAPVGRATRARASPGLWITG